MYPFIKNKIEFIKQIELLINKSENKNKFLKLHRYFSKTWKNQKLLDYNAYLNNEFYDVTNNYSETFNHS